MNKMIIRLKAEVAVYINDLEVLCDWMFIIYSVHKVSFSKNFCSVGLFHGVNLAFFFFGTGGSSRPWNTSWRSVLEICHLRTSTRCHLVMSNSCFWMFFNLNRPAGEKYKHLTTSCCVTIPQHDTPHEPQTFQGQVHSDHERRMFWSSRCSILDFCNVSFLFFTYLLISSSLHLKCRV